MPDVLTPLVQALSQRTGYQVVGKPDITETKISFIGRLPVSQSLDQWLIIVNQLNARSGKGWTGDISKYYFNKANGRLVYAWRLIFVASDIAAAIPDIVAAVRSAPMAARQEVTEVPLIGASPNRNDPSVTGKGAGLFERTAVGPMAIRRR